MPLLGSLQNCDITSLVDGADSTVRYLDRLRARVDVVDPVNYRMSVVLRMFHNDDVYLNVATSLILCRLHLGAFDVSEVIGFWDGCPLT